MIRANAGKYPISAQCEVLGVPRSTYYWVLGHPEAEPAPDPIEQDVVDAFESGRREYGAPRIKRALARRGVVASRRRIARIMKARGLVSSYTKAKFKPARTKANEAELPNILNREFDGYAPHTHIVSDLTYVRIGRRWGYVCLLLDLYNREIVGHACSERKDANLVKASFATVAFPLFEIDVFHTDRGSEFDNMAIDEMLEVFGITRSLSRKGNPYDNAAIESMNKTLKTASVYRRSYSTIDELRHEVNSYVWWYNNERMHSTLGYMSPVEFREAGLSL